MNKVECIISIVERGKSEHLIHTFKEFGCLPHLQFVANGTASSELLDMLGFGTSKRDVIFSIGEEHTTHALMKEIKERDHIHLHTKGIIFTCSVTGLSAILVKATEHLAKDVKREDEDMAQGKDSLILVSLNQGYSDEVMTVAKKYGARGGTVFKANWADAEELENLYGISLHREKEILAIVANNEIQKDIMTNIHKEFGTDKKVQALVLSLPVNDKAIL